MKTSQKQRDQIQAFIQIEMLKRGFTAKIISFEEEQLRRPDETRLVFSSEPFQTVPVLFQDIVVCNFNSSFFETIEPNKGYVAFWISVHVSYNHFTGGSNGCRLFDVRGVLNPDSDGLGVWDLTAN
jgi:hypothetical protein